MQHPLNMNKSLSEEVFLFINAVIRCSDGNLWRYKIWRLSLLKNPQPHHHLVQHPMNYNTDVAQDITQNIMTK